MSIKQDVLASLVSILDNTWAIELPTNPSFPAVVFDIQTTPEQGWCLGGGYDLHTVSIVVICQTLGEIESLRLQIRSAVKTISGFIDEGEHGDAEFEQDISKFAYYMNFVIRRRS